MGRVEYNTEATSSTLGHSGNASLTLNGTGLAFDIPSGNQDRLLFNIAGRSEVFCDLTWNWFGSDSSGFDNPALIVDKNGSLHLTSKSTSLWKLNGYNSHFSTFVDDIDMDEDDYLTFEGSNLSSGNSRGLNLKFHVRLIVKEN